MKNISRIESVFEVVRVLSALAIAYGLALLCLILITDNPGNAVYMFSIGPFTTFRRFGQMIVKFIPYMLCGVGMCFMYTSNRFSIFGEGSYLLSGCMVSVAGFAMAGFDLPILIMLPLLLVVGAMAGGVVGFVPAALGAKFDLNELVVSIMLNHVVLYFTVMILKLYLADPEITFFASRAFPANMHLTQFLRRSNVHTGIFIAPLFVALAAFIFYRTQFGFKIRICGSNPDFARYSGIDLNRNIVLAHTIGGALVGVGACIDIMGIYDRYLWAEFTNYGFYGLVTAVLARKNPILVPFGALLLAYMHTGASILNYTTEVPIEFVQIMQALLILLIAAQTFLSKLKHRLIFNESRKSAAREVQKA